MLTIGRWICQTKINEQWSENECVEFSFFVVVILYCRHFLYDVFDIQKGKKITFSVVVVVDFMVTILDVIRVPHQNH